MNEEESLRKLADEAETTVRRLVEEHSTQSLAAMHSRAVDRLMLCHWAVRLSVLVPFISLLLIVHSGGVTFFTGLVMVLCFAAPIAAVKVARNARYKAALLHIAVCMKRGSEAEEKGECRDGT